MKREEMTSIISKTVTEVIPLHPDLAESPAKTLLAYSAKYFLEPSPDAQRSPNRLCTEHSIWAAVCIQHLWQEQPCYKPLAHCWTRQPLPGPELWQQLRGVLTQPSPGQYHPIKSAKELTDSHIELASTYHVPKSAKWRRGQQRKRLLHKTLRCSHSAFTYCC